MLELFEVEATTAITISLTMTDLQENPVDGASIAFTTRFQPNNGGSPITTTDIFGADGGAISREGVGQYSITHDTEPYIAGGQLSWTWWVVNGIGGPAQGALSGMVTVIAPPIADPFL